MNNLEHIQHLLNFSDPDKFYFIQILKRRKDNPDMLQDMRLIGSYAVSSELQLQRKMEEITRICDSENARAYIRLNRRSKKKVALQLLARLATMIANEQYDAMNSYWSVAGEYAAEEDKTWVVDIDHKDFVGRKELLIKIHAKIEDLQIEAGNSPRMDIIPTKNGYHLLTRPFNLQALKTFLAILAVNIDCHKDNLTLLYIPKTTQDESAYV
jgi:hypothetical protein